MNSNKKKSKHTFLDLFTYVHTSSAYMFVGLKKFNYIQRFCYNMAKQKKKREKIVIMICSKAADKNSSLLPIYLNGKREIEREIWKNGVSRLRYLKYAKDETNQTSRFPWKFQAFQAFPYKMWTFFWLWKQKDTKIKTGHWQSTICPACFVNTLFWIHINK